VSILHFFEQRLQKAWILPANVSGTKALNCDTDLQPLQSLCYHS